MKKNTCAYLKIVTSGIFFCTGGYAENVTWSGTGEGSWSEQTNWSTQTTPSSADSATISNGATVNFAYPQGQTQTVSALLVGGDLKSLLNINSGTLDTSSLQVGNGKISVGGASAEDYGTLASSNTDITPQIGNGAEGELEITGYGKVLMDGNPSHQTQREFKLGVNSGKGTLTLRDNAYLSYQANSSYMVVGDSGEGYMNLYGSSKAEAYYFIVGDENGSYGEINVSGTSELHGTWGFAAGWNGGTGKVTVSDSAKIYADRNIELGLTGTGILEINDSAEVYTVNNLFLGKNANGDGSIIINGGKLRVENTAGAGYGVLVVGSSGKGTLTVNGGELVLDEYIRIANESRGEGEVNLNGGTVHTKGIMQFAGSDAQFGTGAINFDGGTVVANANSYTNFFSNAPITIKSGGGTVDTNGQNLNVNTTVSGIGNFTKTGEGKLTFLGQNTMTGDIIVQNGGVVAGYADALGVGDVILYSDTTLDSSVANANAGGIKNGGGTVSVNGAGAGSFTLSGDFEMTGGVLEITILSVDDFDRFVGDGSNSFAIDGGELSLAGSVIDYLESYQIFEGFLSGFVDEFMLEITGYDSVNYTAHLTNSGLLYFTQNIPEPAAYAALAGLLALLFARGRRRA